MSGTALDSFMQLKSIDPNFINASGEPCIVEEECIKGIVKQLGFDADDDNALLTYYQEEETRHWLSLLPPVSVFQQSASYELEVHLPIDFVTDQLVYRVTTEAGLQMDELLTATDFPLLAVNEISDVEFQLYSVTLPVQLDLGYHHLALLEVGNEEPLAVMHLIITPDVCYQSAQIQKDKKVVSTNISLAHLTADKSETNLLDSIKVQVLPELWTDLYHLDLTAVAEFKHYKTAQDVFKKLNDLTDNDAITVIKAKLDVLRVLFDDFNKQEPQSVKDAFSTFITDGGIDLKQQASFDALHHQFLSENKLTDYLNWPADFQSYSSQGTQNWIAENKQEIVFWQYCYWVVKQQFEALETLIESQGTTLKYYQQVVIGASKNSFKMWANSDVYCQGINIEAPLDWPMTLNQSVEYSPLIPDQLYRSGYQAFIKLLQSSMKRTRVLHIKHIAALLRLWWVPESAQREQGAFVYYNVYDMLNLLALESLRNQCVVVIDAEESLPEGMHELLLEAGVYSSSLFDFR